MKPSPSFNFAFLSFMDKDLETAFREDYFEKRVPQLRLELLLGVILYALFGLHDYWVIPDIRNFAWLVRYAVVCPILVGVLLFSFSGHFRKAVELSTFFAGFAAGAGVVLMIVRAAPPGSHMSYAGLLIILLFYFRLRFVTASSLTLSILVLYGTVAFLDAKIPAHVLYSNTFVLLTFSITGLFMCYTLEQNTRSAFLLGRTIRQRNEEIAATNAELEKEVLERRQVEVALVERMKFLRTLLDTIPNPIFYTGFRGGSAGCNRAYELFFGRLNQESNRPSLPERCAAEIAGGPENVDAQEDGRSRIMAGEALLRHLDGTDRYVHLTTAVYGDIDGRPAGMVGVVMDITRLKQAEEEKSRLEAQIYQAQKIEALGQLAGGVAHEFNNILTAILGYSHILKKKMQEGEPLMFYVDNTIASGERAARLIRDMLAFGRKQKIDPSPVDLNEVVRSSVSFLTMITGVDIELKVDLCHEPVPVMADGNLLSQVLMNLASNARDAMPRGGTVSIRTLPVSMNREFPHAHGTALPGRYSVIRFSDTGIGMDPKTRERIFEPFFSTKEVGKGTGLGLSVVYGIIKQHQGCIDVETGFARGTTFSIYIPLRERAVGIQEQDMDSRANVARIDSVCLMDAQPIHPDNFPYPSGTETVLLAEDNETVRALTRNLLQENGYTVIEAVHGEEAIRKFMEHAAEIRLLLLDVVMPKKNGWEVYDTVRKIRPGVPVIFMSGYTADVFADKIIPEEGMNILQKPVPPGNLLKTLRLELDGVPPAAAGEMGR